MRIVKTSDTYGPGTNLATALVLALAAGMRTILSTPTGFVLQGVHNMTQSIRNQLFLTVVGPQAKNMILDAIAEHYGIRRTEAYSEVTGEGAEHLLEYMTEPHRSAARVLMQRYGII